jgi:hypothetical protein
VILSFEEAASVFAGTCQGAGNKGVKLPDARQDRSQKLQPFGKPDNAFLTESISDLAGNGLRKKATQPN